MKKVIVSLFAITLVVVLALFFARRYMVDNRQMLLCYSAGTFNKCELLSRDRHFRQGYQDSFWIGCMNGLNMADGKGPSKEKSIKCNRQYKKLTSEE